MTIKQTNAVSVLQADVEIVGDVEFSGELHLQGKVNGNIAASNDSGASLFLQESSEVIGEIRAPVLVIAGKVSGDVFASEHVSLHSTAEVAGNVHYIEMYIAPGANINGILTSLKSL